MSVSRKPVCDAALEAAVKKQEEETKKKAPYFGAASRDEALELDAWKRIGEEWHDRVPITCWQAYTKRYPVAGASQVRYDATVKAAVRSGALDAELKRAAAVCLDAGRDPYTYSYQYLDGAPREEVRRRLVELDYKREKDVWLADLQAEREAMRKQLVDRTITYDVDLSTHRVVDVDFLEGQGTELMAFCVPDKTSAEFDDCEEWPCSAKHALIWAAGGVVDEPEEMSEDEEEPPAVPDPPKPPPPPRTRDGKRAAAASAARAQGAKKTCAINSKRARRDKAADAAAARDDVEPDDGEFRDYVPPLEQIEGDKRPTTVNDEALRATIGDVPLLACERVQTPLQRRLEPLEMMCPPKNAPPVRSARVLERIGEVGWKIEDDPDLTLTCRAVEIITDEIEDACGGSGRRGDAINDAADVYLDGRRVKVKNNRNGAACLHVAGPNDGTSSDTSRDFLSYVKRLAADAEGDDKAALEFFAAQCERWLFTRTLLVEFATYPAGRAGRPHRDDEEPDLTNQHDHRDRGGKAKGYPKAGPVKLRLALSVRGRRSMSFRDKRGWVATIDRSPGRGVCFVDGAHTYLRGVVEHCNDAGDAPGATLILTFRADASSAFGDMTPAERLFAHAGIALFAAH